jgi:hypothetical protein
MENIHRCIQRNACRSPNRLKNPVHAWWFKSLTKRPLTNRQHLTPNISSR